jgi:CBS domain-containing protein
MRNPIVADVMTKDPYTVGLDTDYKTIVDLLVGKQIGAVAVLAPDGFPMGVVSEADLLLKEENDGHFTGRRERKATALVAKDLMTAKVYSVAADDTLTVAARELARRGVRRLFVIDGGRIVGVVSRRDLLSVFRRTDDDIRQQIVREVLIRGLWADPKAVGVMVENGVVTMLGRLERRCEVQIAGRLAAQIPGVVEVRNRLDHVWNDMPERQRR